MLFGSRQGLLATLALYLALVTLAAAQQQQGSQQPQQSSQQQQASPRPSASGSSGQPASVTPAANASSTPTPAPIVSTYVTVSGNRTLTLNTTLAPSTTPSTLPVASNPTTGALAGTAVAPAPGIKGDGAKAGPNDSYISRASTLLLGPGSVVIGVTTIAVAYGAHLLL